MSRAASRHTRAAAKKKPVAGRLRVRDLEARVMPSTTYLVNLPGDVGNSSGATSGDIRFAVTQANANPGSTILFNTALSGSTITLSHGELAITSNMKILGPGAASLTISGSSGATSSRVFD